MHALTHTKPKHIQKLNYSYFVEKDGGQKQNRGSNYNKI